MNGYNNQGFKSGKNVSNKTRVRRYKPVIDSSKSASDLFRMFQQVKSKSKSVNHLVLTYSNTMIDYYRVIADFDGFWSSLANDFPGLDYICAIELHGEDGWYMNMLVINKDDTDLFIPYDAISSIWAFGECFVGSDLDVSSILPPQPIYILQSVLSAIDKIIVPNCVRKPALSLIKGKG